MRNKVFAFFTQFRVRLLVTALLIVALSLGGSFALVYREVVQASQRENEIKTIEAFAKVEQNILWMLESAMDFSALVQLEPSFLSLIYQDYQTEIEESALKIELMQSLDRYVNAHSFINAVIFFQRDGRIGGTSPLRSYFFTEAGHPFFATETYRQAIENPGATFWLTQHLRYFFSQSTPAQRDSLKDIMIAGIRALRLGDEAVPRVALLVSIEEQSLRRFYEQLMEEETDIVLLDASGKLFSGMPIERFGTIPEYVSQIDASAKYGSFPYPFEEEHQIVYYRIDHTDWLLVKTTPMRIYQKEMLGMGAYMLQIGGVTLLLLLLFLTGSIAHYTRPIEKLTRTMNQAGEGRLSVVADTHSNIYEIKSLSQAFNQMLVNLRELFERAQQLEGERLYLEIETLQNQLRPHFIYNTITSIRWMATFAGADGVSQALVTLIRLLRPIFDSRAVVWSLREEVDFLTNYCALMQMRYGKDVLLAAKMDEKTLDQVMLPRFLLQPSVENSFEHAMKGREHLSIVLSIEQHDAQTILYVADDGAGMEAEQRKRIERSLSGEALPEEPEQAASQRRGIGLLNCHRRLQLLYGEGAGIRIYARGEGGTIIAFHMPRKL